MIDFAVLNTAVKHFLDQGYNVTIAATGISIYLSDYDAPFLKAHLPDEPPPAVDVDVAPRSSLVPDPSRFVADRPLSNQDRSPTEFAEESIVRSGQPGVFGGTLNVAHDEVSAEMASFRRAGHEQVNVFEIDDTYLFKHYFEGEDIFDRLKRYYNNQQYRFEVPSEDFEKIREFLDEHGYGLVVVDVIEEFIVVVRKYTAHPNNIFKASVIQRSVDDYNCFLMTDQEAVDRAVKEGATRLTESDVENPF